MVTIYSGGFLKERKTLNPSVIAVPRPDFLDRTKIKILPYSFRRFLTRSAVPSGLESSITKIEQFKFKLSISCISLLMFAASQYVGRSMPTSEFMPRFPSIKLEIIFLAAPFNDSVDLIDQLLFKFYP